MGKTPYNDYIFGQFIGVISFLMTYYSKNKNSQVYILIILCASQSSGFPLIINAGQLSLCTETHYYHSHLFMQKIDIILRGKCGT